MPEILPFFLILFAGVFFSTIFIKAHLPWVVSLIIGGIIVGPFGLQWIEINNTAEFIGQIGLVFLMFMAGLETKISSFKGFEKNLLLLSFINGALPFVVGLGIGYYFNYSLITSLLLGVIFISSSIAVVIPSLEKNSLLQSGLGHSVVMTSVIQDIASLILLSIILQNIDPVTNLPLIIFYPIVIFVLIIFRFLLPKIIKLVLFVSRDSIKLYEQNFRVVFLFLLGTVLVFELLGLHPIIAAFFAGLVLSETIESKTLIHKVHTISYGIFIPTFFVIIGAQTNINVLTQINNTLPLVATVIIGSVLSKFVSGWLAGKLVGYNSDQSLLFAISSIPQLSTTLAVVATATSLNLLDEKMNTAMVLLSIVTVLVSPSLMNIFGERLQKAAQKIK